MTTFAPDLARFVQRHDKPAFIGRLARACASSGWSPCQAFGFLVLRRPLIGALLEHGEFGPVAAERTADALGGFALGLVGFSIYLFVMRGFYAHQDTRTPFFINVGENVVNIVLAVVLSVHYGVLDSAWRSPSPTSSRRSGRYRSSPTRSGKAIAAGLRQLRPQPRRRRPHGRERCSSSPVSLATTPAPERGCG